MSRGEHCAYALELIIDIDEVAVTFATPHGSNASAQRPDPGYTMASLAAVYAQGRAGGRPRLMTRAKLRTALAMMADRGNAATDVAEQLGISLSTLYAYVDGEGQAKPRARRLLGAASR